MEELVNVLYFYGIIPSKTKKISSNVYWISNGAQEFALKRSKLSKEQIADWENVYHLANSKEITEILPLCLTSDGRLYQELNRCLYYLTPWMASDTEEREDSIGKIYETLGNFHAKTKQTGQLPMDKMKSSFHAYHNQCKKARHTLMDAVDQFEKNHYMSPFELLVCTQFRDLEMVLNENEKYISQFLDRHENEIEWNYCLSHGNFDASHVMEGYLINMENAHYNQMITDLVGFYQQASARDDFPSDQIIKNFDVYMNKNELSKNEMQLLSIYLLNPLPYMQLLHRYQNQATKVSMIQQIKEIQQSYRRLLFGLEWCEHIEKKFEAEDIMLDEE